VEKKLYKYYNKSWRKCLMIKVMLSNEILKYITEIDKNRYQIHDLKIPGSVASKLRKNSKKEC